MDDTYIFIEGADNTGTFIKESTVIAVHIDEDKHTAVIATSDGEQHIVVGTLDVYQLREHFYQRAPLKLFREKQ